MRLRQPESHSVTQSHTRVHIRGDADRSGSALGDTPAARLCDVSFDMIFTHDKK